MAVSRHGHKNCKYFVVPKTRTKWWLNIINAPILNRYFFFNFDLSYLPLGLRL